MLSFYISADDNNANAAQQVDFNCKTPAGDLNSYFLTHMDYLNDCNSKQLFSVPSLSLGDTFPLELSEGTSAQKCACLFIQVSG